MTVEPTGDVRREQSRRTTAVSGRPETGHELLYEVLQAIKEPEVTEEKAKLIYQIVVAPMMRLHRLRLIRYILGLFAAMVTAVALHGSRLDLGSHVGQIPVEWLYPGAGAATLGWAVGLRALRRRRRRRQAADELDEHCGAEEPPAQNASMAAKGPVVPGRSGTPHTGSGRAGQQNRSTTKVAGGEILEQNSQNRTSSNISARRVSAQHDQANRSKHKRR